VAFQIINESTLSAIVQNVAQLVSFPTPSDPAGDQDPAVIQMVQAVNRAGADLIAMYDWQEQTRLYSMQIVATGPGVVEQAYDLPEDFYEWIDETQWNATNRWPAIGPVTPQQWQQLITLQVLPTLSFYWQVRQNRLYILSPPTTEQTLTFFYQSLAWVRDADLNQELYKNRATKNGDIILLDPQLVTLYAWVKWLEMKDLDSSAAMRDFQIAYENRAGREKGAPVLSMVRMGLFPYINPMSNLPVTGYGLT
jgi:hypothetical protein